MRGFLAAACVIALVQIAESAQSNVALGVVAASPAGVSEASSRALSVPSPQGSVTLLRVADVEHQRVATAQLRLRSLGLYHGTTNGTLGPQTRSALSDYQRKLNLPVTGQLDEATAYSLENNELLKVCAARSVAATDCLGAIEQFYAMLDGPQGATSPVASDRIVRQTCEGAKEFSDCESAVTKMSAWLSTRSTLQK